MSASRKQHTVFVVGDDISTVKMFQGRLDYLVQRTDHHEPDIVVFTGGPDVNPLLYSEDKLSCTFPDLDREAENFDYWNKWPAAFKVGICFGGQWLNVMSGGAMWQDVDNHQWSHMATNVLKLPEFDVGEAFEVTSSHHQMMRPSADGEVLMIANEAKNFLSQFGHPRPKFDTEVVWYKHTKCLCFQPHPEWMGPEDLEQRYFFQLLEYFNG